VSPSRRMVASVAAALFSRENTSRISGDLPAIPPKAGSSGRGIGALLLGVPARACGSANETLTPFIWLSLDAQGAQSTGNARSGKKVAHGALPKTTRGDRARRPPPVLLEADVSTALAGKRRSWWRWFRRPTPFPPARG